MTNAEKLYNNLDTLMTNLYCRWQDEKEYEDINDYGDVLKPRIEEVGGRMIRMLKRPFGFRVALDGKEYKFSHTAKTYSYKRVK